MTTRRTFELLSASKTTNGPPIKDLPKSFFKGNWGGAAKKALSKVCNVLGTPSECKLFIVLREVTPSSHSPVLDKVGAEKKRKYEVNRHEREETVMKEPFNPNLVFKYVATAKSLGKV